MRFSSFGCPRPALVLLLVTVFSSSVALAQVAPRHSDPLMAKVLAPGGFVATPVPQDVGQVGGELDSRTRAEIDAFKSEAGPNWSFHVDRRSGGMSLIKGEGIRWVTAEPSIDDLAQKAMALMSAYPALFQVPAAELVLDQRGSVIFGENNQYAAVVFNQVINGVPVDASRIGFYVSHGKLVMFGVDRIASSLLNIRSTTPAVPADQARLAFVTYIGGLQSGDVFYEDANLIWVLRGTGDGVASGTIGTGWDAHLVYRFVFGRGQMSNWEALVSAATGQVVRFVDANEYASVVAKASVLTVSNCTDPLNCSISPTAPVFAGNQPEVPVTMPYLKLNFAGGICTGDRCYTNGGGAFDYPSGSTGAAATLEGKYFRISDGCGASAVAGTAPGGFDFGTSNPVPFPGNIDCAPGNRQSAPDSNPSSAGPGNTHSARNTYYHLNLIAAKSRFFLPTNEWLKGAGGSRGTVNVFTNLPPACNAFWLGLGNQGTLNFLRFTPGLNCNNTGELVGVFLHEYGHGLDQNDGSGTAPEGGTGEAMGDTFALLEGQQPCIGSGFILTDPTVTNPWFNKAGYGSSTTGSNTRHCSGVRTLDYRELCSRDTTVNCVNRDPDAPNGSRSGFNPGLTTSDAGTPARYNHMINLAGNAADGRSQFYSCGAPGASCAGPLTLECHCESQIASQANWDFTKLLIENVFGGNIYNSPQGPTEVAGWQYMDRLWYLTRDTATSAYTASGPSPNGVTSGCAASTWFQQYLFVDDDNGNLADGTPHADLLFTAFDRHAIACGAATDASNLSNGRGTPPPAPTLSACSTTSPLQLTWNAVAGATKYRVLRNTLGCGFGFTPLKTVSGSNLYYEDAEVAPGVPYFYAVQSIGEDDSAYGFVSSCVTITPTTCTPTTVPAPTGTTATASADNQITVSWSASAGATLYKVLRKDGTCTAPGTYAPVGVTSATSFVDNDALVGSKSYSYQVVATNAACASCTSAPSNCASAVAIGACTIPPTFAGATSVVSSAASGCKLTVRWSPAASNCAAPAFTYSVYRDTSATFLPSTANLVASVTGTEYIDFSVTGGTRYYYIVRATDGRGNTDLNVVRKFETATGKATATTFSDNVEGTQRFVSVPLVGGADWVVKTDGTLNPTKTYATQAGSFYATGKCQSLQSEALFLGANPTLSFTTRFGMQSGLVGGIVQVATEASNFSTWRKLNTINYPGAMEGTLVLGCNDPGFANGERVFNGTPPVNTTANWLAFSASLSEFANQRVKIRFLFSSENGAGLIFNGWLLDNIAISDSRVAGSCGANTAPVAQNDSVSTSTNASVTLDVLANDSDADADKLRVTAVSQGTRGSVLNNRNGTVTYTPAAGSAGADSFSYTISDDQGGSASSIVTVTVSDTPQPPVLFGHDAIADFSATSGEPFIRVAPYAPFKGNIYSTVPFGLSTTVSLLWRSIDGGKSFIPLGSPITRDAVTGPGGGDTHLDFDEKGRLYYADLSGGCVMAAVSEDGGNTFPPDRTNHLTCIGGGDDPQGAQDDRQWVAAFGDGLGYVTARNLIVSVGGNFHLFRTRDAGRTWRGQVIGSVTQSGPLQVDKTKRKVLVGGVEKDAILIYQPYYLNQTLAIFRIIDFDDGGPVVVENPPGFTPGGSVSTVFPILTIDNAGNLYYTWSNGTAVFMATSLNRGQTWSAPIRISPTSFVGSNIMPWIVAGDPGRVNVVWYHTPTANNASAVWNIYMAQSLNAIGTAPSLSVTKVSETVIHRGEICTRGLACDLPVIPIVNPLGPGDRSFLEFPSIDIDSAGAAAITFNDNTNQADGAGRPGGAYVMVTRQTGGPSLFSSVGAVALDPGSVTITQPSEGQVVPPPTVPVAGTHTLPADNINSDETGDAKFPDHGAVIGSNIPALDIRDVTFTDDASSVTVTMRLGDLTTTALATAAAQSGGDGVLFLTQWDFNDEVYWVAAEVRAGAPVFYTGALGIIKSATSKKFITYNPDLLLSQQVTGGITNTAPGLITIRIPRSLVGAPANGSPLFTTTAYTMSERGPLVPVGDLEGQPNPSSLPIQVDATAPFTYVVGNGSPVDGVVEVSLDAPSFANPTPASANVDGTWSATLNNVAPGAHTAYARQRINGRGPSPAALVHFTVVQPNRAAVAVNDAYATAEDITLNVAAPGVLANDTDADGNPLSAVLVSGPANGTLTFLANGSFSYTPAANFNGSDSFTYKVNDGTVDSNVGTVAITVSEVNDAMVAANDSVTTAEDTAATISVLANDSAGPANESAQSLTVTSASPPAHGSATVNANNTITYTPAANYSGPDSFTYSACDNGTTGGAPDPKCASATVSITVTAVNDPPLANNDAYSTKPSGTLTVAAPGVLANDSDIDSSTLTATLVSGVSNGTLTLNTDGSFVYRPSSGFKGVDTFTYKANDGQADSNVATVSITVDSSSGNKVKLTGAGEVQVFNPNGLASFGFNVKRDTVDGSPTGQLDYFNHARNLSVQSVSITSLNVAGTSATFSGTCTKNGAPCTFTVTIQDNGTPGRGVDRFTIAVSGEPVEGGEAPITSGNISIK